MQQNRFIIGILISNFAFFSCKSQTPIVPIDTNYHDTVEGAYFKDLNNELNPFIGTWVYTNGNTTFTIVLQKIDMNYDGEHYEDILVGEYSYIENGMEIVNTIPQLDGQIANQINNIFGRKLIDPDYYNVPCDDCSSSERRVKLHMIDPERSYLPADSIIIRHLPNETPEKISIIIKSENGGIIPVDVPDHPRYPYGEFVLTKQ